MISRLRILLLTPLAALLACSSHAIVPVPTTAAVSGDYVLNVTPVAGGTFTSFSGNLYISGSTVSGAFLYNNGNSLCSGQSFPVIGTINSNGLMTLSSSSFTGSFSGNTATITIQTPLDVLSGQVPNSSGTAQIAAGTGTNCALASSTLTANYLSPYNGTWTGTVSSGAATGTATLIVGEVIPDTTQTATSTAGLIPVTASLNLTGVCSFTTPIQLTGQISGYSLQLTQVSNAPPVTVLVNNASTIVGFSMTIPSGALNAAGTGPLGCPTGSYSGSVAPH
jgi:hypothetical protein